MRIETDTVTSKTGKGIIVCLLNQTPCAVGLLGSKGIISCNLNLEVWWRLAASLPVALTSASVYLVVGSSVGPGRILQRREYVCLSRDSNTDCLIPVRNVVTVLIELSRFHTGIIFPSIGTNCTRLGSTHTKIGTI